MAFRVTDRDVQIWRRMRRWIEDFSGKNLANSPNGATVTGKGPRPRNYRERDRRTRRMQVTAIHNDYLEAKIIGIDGTVSDTIVNVARKETTRHSADQYDGITSWTTIDAQTADASDGDTTERIKVTPAYFVGGYIKAEPTPRGGTGVEDAPDWIVDDGREWARVAS